MLTVTLIKTGGGMHGGMNVRSICKSGNLLSVSFHDLSPSRCVFYYVVYFPPVSHSTCLSPAAFSSCNDSFLISYCPSFCRVSFPVVSLAQLSLSGLPYSIATTALPFKPTFYLMDLKKLFNEAPQCLIMTCLLPVALRLSLR